jgi:hypothetical protein
MRRSRSTKARYCTEAPDLESPSKIDVQFGPANPRADMNLDGSQNRADDPARTGFGPDMA